MTPPSCIDCNWCSVRVGLFGRVTYLCERKRRPIQTTVVADRFCDRFERPER
jgi:hypothetical protein